MGSGLFGPWIKLAGAIALALATIAVPTAWVASGPSLCLVRWATGCHCPGCGMTRAVSSMVHGDIAAAIRFNGLVVVVFPLLCCLWARYVFGQFRRIATGHLRRSARADRPTVPRTTGA